MRAKEFIREEKSKNRLQDVVAPSLLNSLLREDQLCLCMYCKHTLAAGWYSVPYKVNISVGQNFWGGKKSLQEDLLKWEDHVWKSLYTSSSIPE